MDTYQNKIRTPLRSLQILGVLSIAIPLFFYAVFAALRYQESREEAGLRVSRSLRVAHEHATKVVGGAEAIQDRVFDLVNGRSLADLRKNQPALHLALVARAKDQPQIQSIWVIGADGRPVATSRFSVAPDRDYSDREYMRFHRSGQNGRYLSPPLVARTTNESIVDISLRFNDENGQFGGVINISLLTSYFRDFYSDLVADEPGLAVNLFRQDGAIFTRWPTLENAPARLAEGSPVMTRLAAGLTSAQMRGVSSVDEQDRLIAFQRVGEYPLYVGTGMNLATLRNELLRELALLLALGMPPFVALFLVSRVALRSTREALAASELLEQETVVRRRAEEALFQSQKLEALGRLTGGVAHDFNNALMVINSNLYLLKRIVTGTGTAQLDSIGRAVRSATKLTRQLLAFSRRQALVPEYVRLQDKLPMTEELIAPVLGSQIKLAIEVAADTHAVLVDQAELELALLNLAINARDAMPAAGSFRISARNTTAQESELVPPVDYVVIQATDTGTGIAPELLHKVFEPFFTTKPLGQGTGLGLSQVYGLCQRAGGRAAVSSTPGQGTTVSLFFPAASAELTSGVVPVVPVNRQLHKRVLLVEDNDDVAEALAPVLEALGCSVHRVDRAAAALAWLTDPAHRPDLVLTDVVMPGDMDGIGLARHIKQSLPALPVLLMTGYAEQIDAIAELGFEVLPKPCSADMLSAAILRTVARDVVAPRKGIDAA